MNEILSSILMIIGATFALLAGAGVVRMPDLFTRMQAATKASTLGIGCIVSCGCDSFWQAGHHRLALPPPLSLSFLTGARLPRI